MRLSHAEMRTCAITTSCRRWCWRAYWLLEQGSNLQALRHLINSQARFPIPPSRIREPRSIVSIQIDLKRARANEHERDVPGHDEVGVSAAAQERQSGATVREGETDRISAIGRLRLHRDVQEFAHGLISILQPQLRRNLLRTQLEACSNGAGVNIA